MEARQSERPDFRLDIQGLRGVAVLLVVAYHAGLPLTGGFVGVDVFFVLSGFVITEGLIRSLDRRGFSYATFYAKRVRRLLPALALVVSVGLALMPFLNPPAGLYRSTRTAVAAVGLNANHYLYLGGSYFSSRAEYNSMLHTWSLSVEEQFYLVFPFLIVLFWGRSGVPEHGRRRLMRGLLAFGLVSLAFSLMATWTPRLGPLDGPRVAFYTALSRSWEFGLGAMLAAAGPALQRVRGAATTLGWIGLGMVLVASLVLTRETVFPGTAALLPAVGTMLLLLPGATHAGRSVLVRALSMRWLTRTGDLSYSWYLWHWPLIVFAVATWPDRPLPAAIAASVASFVAAWATERWFENPIRFRPAATRRPTWQVAFACVAIPLGIAAAQPLLVRAVPTETLAWDALSARDEYAALGCEGSRDASRPDPRCVTGSPGTWRALLIGDSNARHHIPGAQEAVRRLGGELVITTLASCPFADLWLEERGVPAARCRRWVEASIDALETTPFDVVFVANAVDMYLDDPRRVLRGDPSGVAATTYEAKAAVLREATERVVASLVAKGSTVVLIEPIPKFVRSDTRGWRERHAAGALQAAGARCSALGLLAWPTRCQVTRPLGGADGWTDPGRSDDVHGGLEGPQVLRLDLSAWVCPAGICGLLDEEAGRLRYHDTEHLQPWGSLQTAAGFEASLAEALRRREP